MVEHKNPNLKNKAVFVDRDMVMGIPARVFVATVLLTFFTAFVFCKYLPLLLGIAASLVLSLLILLPVYLVHRDDPEAYMVWLRSLFTAARLTASRSTRRRVLMLTHRAGGDLHIQSIFSTQESHP
ncbi:MAG TPA: hypothetical protein ENI17_02685 [Pseudomonas xinjiangensis]|uniref:Type IV secretion system protein VirB3 n=2 Tax=root TaxID=1 RepID=A0A7V1FTM6_9GAMM|nr:hypothetical protein [Halopseudomonas xinjiangensis]HEC46516.1 hypothetical protein [Halopseudomonas xinjiangensis]